MVTKQRLLAIMTLALLFIGLPLSLLRSTENDTQRSYYSPEHYVNRVNDLIEKEYLVAECDDKDKSKNTKIKLTDKTPDPEKKWYQASYLKTDVNRFNLYPDSYGWTFYVDDSCKLKNVNSSIRNFKLPFANRERWQGRILYEGKSTNIALRSTQRTIALHQVSEGQDYVPVRVGTKTSLNVDKLLLHFNGGKTQPAALFSYVGDKVVINNRTDNQSSGEVVRIMGYKMPVGRLAWLKSGDWLHVSARLPSPAKETFLFSTEAKRPIASAMPLRNGKLQRIYPEDAMLGWYTDQTGGQFVPFLQVFTQRLDSMLSNLPSEHAKSLVDFDIQLSLQRDLQFHMNETFHDSCDKISRDNYKGKPFTAGVTVMDGKSGKILAMSTYPWPDDIPDEMADSKRSIMLRNQNLVRHPVGSVTKPFFFAAITDTYPQLLDLEIEGYSANKKHTELFQCTLTGGYKIRKILPPVKGKPRRLNFVTALARSSNKYTIELATLAMAADSTNTAPSGIHQDTQLGWPKKGKSSGIWIKGRKLRHAPDLRHIDYKSKSNKLYCHTLKTKFEKIKFREPLEILTGASTYLGEAPALPDCDQKDHFYDSYHLSRYDRRPWRALFKHMTKDLDGCYEWIVRSKFEGISPDRVNLAFNKIEHLRQDYISLLLGGGRGVWTNIQLAEAMSRLVTGRQINATLVSAILNREGETVTPSEEQPPLVSLNKKVRDKVLTGLRQVVKAGEGTAHRLNSTLTELEKEDYLKDSLFLFSKTGSPTLTKPDIKTGAVYVFTLVKVPGRIKNYIPTIEQLADPKTKVITVALHLEMGKSSPIAVEVAKRLLKDIPFLD
jgi:hypothetical protein